MAGLLHSILVIITCECATVERMSKTFSRRWKGYSVADVSESMRKLAARKALKMSKGERVAHGEMMAAARGEWKKIDGKKVYVRK